jgi:hypothetical protein
MSAMKNRPAGDSFKLRAECALVDDCDAASDASTLDNSDRGGRLQAASAEAPVQDDPILKSFYRRKEEILQVHHPHQDPARSVGLEVLTRILVRQGLAAKLEVAEGLPPGEDRDAALQRLDGVKARPFPESQTAWLELRCWISHASPNLIPSFVP